MLATPPDLVLLYNSNFSYSGRQDVDVVLLHSRRPALRSRRTASSGP
jgi:hypothetical protein